MRAQGLTGLDLTARTTTPRITHLRYRRFQQGIPAFDGGVRMSLDRAGRVVSVTGGEQAVQRVESVVPRLDALDALRALGVQRRVAVVSGPSGVRRTTRFAGGDFARLVLFGSGRATRLAWHLTYRASALAHYDAVIDATDGTVLFLQNLTKDAARADVFRSHPGTAPQIEVDLEQELWLPAGEDVLDGPYARVYSDLDDDGDPSLGEEIFRTGGHFEFPFTTYTGSTCLADAKCSWDPIFVDSWEDNRARSGVQAFYLVNRFRDHLAEDGDIGFGGFAGADAVQVETDDGSATGPNASHVNNASMSTLPEGLAPTMQLHRFTGSGFRNVHAADSAAIVWHEYTHGLSSRLVTHDDGAGALSSPQAGAMGEGWSDWYALDLLASDGSRPDGPTLGEMDLGHYTDHVAHTLRRQGLDCPVGSGPPRCPGTPGAGPGGFTFGDFGRVGGGHDVHDDGEIWGETLWDLRAALGSNRAQALITEGMRMAPPEPSFLDMRNAILAAEAALPGDHRAAVWQVFARRGMGYLAHTEDAGDLAPEEDFSVPPAPGAPRGRTTGTVTSAESGLALGGVSVGFGGLFGAAAFPDQLATTTAANGSFALDAPAGIYRELTVEEPGYERDVLPGFQVAAGATRVHDVALRRDWAARASGARVLSGDDTGAVYGCGRARLIDQDRLSGWSAWNPASPESPFDGPPAAVVRLPQAIDVTGFGLDPANVCGNDERAATGGFRIEVSRDGVSYSTAVQGAFGAAHRGRLNVFGADLRGVTHVRVTLLSPQGAGSDFIDLSELVVFGAPPNRLPTGSLAASRMRLTAGGSVSFAAAFTDPDSRITGYDWDFDGDGTVDRSTAAPATEFAYRRAGSFAASVAARDFRGGAGSAARTITVTRLPRPVVRLPRRGRRGRVTVAVRCAQRCTVTARLRVGGRTVRTVRRAVRGERRIAVTLPRKVRRGRSVRARLLVSARYGDGRTTSASRSLRIGL